MKTRWTFALLLLASVAFVRADGPGDNIPDKVRPIPPPGIAVPVEDRAELQAGVDALGKEIDRLRASLKGQPALLDLLPDIQVYHNAVRYALTYNEFFGTTATPDAKELTATREVAVAKALLKQGTERAAQLRAGRPAWTTATGLVVRGYVSGSGWKDYQATGKICGIALPSGLRESGRLPEPIFTPATKAATGHDENISFEQAAALIGRELAERVRRVSLEIYQRATKYAEPRGILLADTKFEFGLLKNSAGVDELIWIDEALTPDSSRFWPAAQFQPGGPQPSFDKQFVRDYLERIQWPKTPPGPELPPDVVAATRAKYREAYRILVGRELD